MVGGSKRKAPSQATSYMRKRTKQTISKRVKKLEKALNKDSLERKLDDYSNLRSTAVQVSSAAPLLLYSMSVASGTQWYQRIGNEVFLQSLVGRIDIRCGRTVSNYRPPAFRVIVGFQRYDAAGTFTASSICTGLFGTATPAVEEMYLLRVNDGLIGKKYIILKDKMYLGPGNQNNMVNDGVTDYTSPWRRLIQLKTSMKNNIVRWDNTSATAPQENRPFVLIISDNSATEGIGASNPVDIFAQIRLFFTEKKVV